ncbi:LPS assembly lipoprotein LptE [soil metagenome]
MGAPRTLLALALSAAALVLSACGFTPLYAEGGVSPGLSAVEVVAPDGRTAFLLRERLEDALAHDRGKAPAYRLNYALTETRTPRGLGPDNAASRYELNVRVDWKLTDLVRGAEVKTGRTDVLITYGAADQPYAGVAAQENGQDRAAAEAARRMRLDLAQYFAASHPAKTAAR